MRLIKAKNHSFTALVDQTFLHSKYSPENEADKFFRNWLKENDRNSEYIVVFEPGLGYLLDLVKSQFSPKKIIVIFYHFETYRYCFESGALKGLFFWFPKHNSTLEEFLEVHLGNMISGHIGVLEWPPAGKCFPKKSGMIQKQFIQYLRILQGNTLTTMKFGRKWLYNGLRNFLERDYSLTIGGIDKPAVIVASGFSLNNLIGDLKSKAKSFFIVALPSSVKTLNHAGIIPDLIITTDPGYYASVHYQSFPENACVAAPITSAPGLLNTHIAGIHQQSWLDYLLDPGGVFLTLKSPEMGTVAATAIKLMEQLSPQGLYIMGLDLCMKGIHEHAAPHCFDIYSTLASGRMRPEINNRFQRVHVLAASYDGGYHYSKSLNTYRDWFQKEKFRSQIFRIAPSPVALSFQNLEALPDISAAPDKSVFYRNSDYPRYEKRKDDLSVLFSMWNNELKQISHGKPLDASYSIGKLIKNLFPGYGINMEPEAVVASIRGIIKKVGKL